MTPPPTPSATPRPLTDLAELAPLARELVERELSRFLPDEPVTQRFHREWSGGWRVRVEVGRPPRGKLDFVLFETPGGGLLAMAHPMPPAWRDPAGVVASDGSRWCWTESGLLEPVK